MLCWVDVRWSDVVRTASGFLLDVLVPKCIAHACIARTSLTVTSALGCQIVQFEVYSSKDASMRVSHTVHSIVHITVRTPRYT